MRRVPPPTRELADLAAALGEDNVRAIARTYLRDFPTLIRGLSEGPRKDRHRIAHSMKSNSRLVGALELSQRMAEIEERLSTEDGADVSPSELEEIRREFAEVATPLKAFADA